MSGKHHGRRMDGRTDGHAESSILPPTLLPGYKNPGMTQWLDYVGVSICLSFLFALSMASFGSRIKKSHWLQERAFEAPKVKPLIITPLNILLDSFYFMCVKSVKDEASIFHLQFIFLSTLMSKSCHNFECCRNAFMHVAFFFILSSLFLQIFVTYDFNSHYEILAMSSNVKWRYFLLIIFRHFRIGMCKIKDSMTTWYSMTL
jgi:hypothetical protein